MISEMIVRQCRSRGLELTADEVVEAEMTVRFFSEQILWCLHLIVSVCVACRCLFVG